MRFDGFKKLNRYSKVLWTLLCVSTVSAIGISIADVAQTNYTHVAILLSSIFVTFLLSQYELRLPKTQIEIAIGSAISIWSVFWLGESGGVLLCAAASLAVMVRERNASVNNIFGVFANTTALAASAILYTVLIRPAGSSSPGWHVPLDVEVIAYGTTFIATLNFGLSTLIEYCFRIISGSPRPTNKRELAMRAAGQVPVITAALMLCVLFNYFGIEFGLVIVPMAVFAILAYRVHLKRLQQKTAQILEASRVHLATVEALATAIDARDQIGNGHVRRVQMLAVSIGEAFSLSEDEINALRTGALLHDIGKLAIPDHILSKAGTLTPPEMEKVKIHSAIGASILENVGFTYPVVPTVRHHHEYWDGKGYPDRLAGERIPLTARILSLADVYDTLRSPRPFRPAFTREQARAHVLERSGTQFDPTVVSVFLKRLTAFEAMIEDAGLHYEDSTAVGSALAKPSAENYVEQIKLANKEVFTLFELAREFGSTPNLQVMLELLSQRIKALVPYDTCSVYLLDASGRYADAVYVVGENRELLSTSRITVGKGATGTALKRLKPVTNVNPDLDFSISHLELIQQYSTMAAMPLHAEGRSVGAVSIYSNDLPSYGEEHIRLLEAITRIAAEAIAKSRQHAEAQAHALTDPMTGLPNARSLKLEFEKEVGRADRAGNTLQVIVMDLDGFKAVNDTYGHKVGDEMLRSVGAIIKQQLRDYDFLARYGGDEFVALVPDAGYEVVSDLCGRIEEAVTGFRLRVDNQRTAQVGVSTGAAGYPVAGKNFDQIIVAADKAMYNRKVSRKRGDVLAELEMAPEIRATETRIEETIDDDVFIVELDDSHVVNSTAIN